MASINNGIKIQSVVERHKPIRQEEIRKIVRSKEIIVQIMQQAFPLTWHKRLIGTPYDTFPDPDPDLNDCSMDPGCVEFYRKHPIKYVERVCEKCPLILEKENTTVLCMNCIFKDSFL